jgi:hypothetical protein
MADGFPNRPQLWLALKSVFFYEAVAVGFILAAWWKGLGSDEEEETEE